MLIKRTYFDLMCDGRYPNGRCTETLTIYTRIESEPMAGESARREARRRGWKIVSRGRGMLPNAFCNGSHGVG